MLCWLHDSRSVSRSVVMNKLDQTQDWQERIPSDPNCERTVSDACNSALVTLSLEHEPAAITRSIAPQALAPMRHFHSCLRPAVESTLSISRALFLLFYDSSQAVLRYISDTR